LHNQQKDKGEDTSKQQVVVPVGLDFDNNDYFYVSGVNILKSNKNKNVLKKSCNRR